MKQCIRPKFQQWIAGTVVLIGVLGGIASVFCCARLGDAQPCDKTLTPVTNWTLKYRERGNRCEGFYQEPTGGKLDIVGVIDGAFQFQFDAQEVIRLSVPNVTDQPVTVWAVGIPMKTYYRMDAQLTPGQTLTWPVQDVILQGIRRSEKLGVFGWIGDEQQKTYIPVNAVSGLNPQKSDGNIRLQVRTSININNVQWRAGDIKNGATTGLSAWKPVPNPIDPNGVYSPGEVIEILLPPSRTGELYVEVSVRSQDRDESIPPLSAYILVGRR